MGRLFRWASLPLFPSKGPFQPKELASTLKAMEVKISEREAVELVETILKETMKDGKCRRGN